MERVNPHECTVVGSSTHGRNTSIPSFPAPSGFCAAVDARIPSETISGSGGSVWIKPPSDVLVTPTVMFGGPAVLSAATAGVLTVANCDR